MTSLDTSAIEAAHQLATSPGEPTLIRISHRVYRCTKDDRAIVVKLFQPDSTGTYQRELAGVDAAATAVGSWAAHPAGNGPLASGHHYVAYDEITGTDLHTAVETTQVDRPNALELIGTALARFHRQTRTSAPSFGPVTEPTATNARDLMATLIDHRAPLLARHDEPALAAILVDIQAKLEGPFADRTEAVLCHGDLHLRNVIVATTDGRPEVRGIVDYESVTFAVPEYDLAKTVVVCNAFTTQDRQALLAGYGDRQDIDDAVLADLVTYHTIDGRLWAALTEHWDHHLWRTRLQTVLP